MPAKPYKAADHLKTPEDIATYLNVVIEEMHNPQLLMIALRSPARERCQFSAHIRDWSAAKSHGLEIVIGAHRV